VRSLLRDGAMGVRRWLVGWCVLPWLSPVLSPRLYTPSTSTSGESSELGPAHIQAGSERGGERARRCSNDEGRASKNAERPPISPAVGFDSASRHAPVMLRSPHVQPSERRLMMVSRGAERMSRPSQMEPRMQVQSAIASRPACSRVCAQLSCLVLHARTLRPPLNQPRGDRSPPPLHRCPCCLAIAGRPLRPRALDGRAGIRAHVRAAVGPIGAAMSSHAALCRDPVRAVAARSPARVWQAADRGQANRPAERRSARERLLDSRALMEHAG
jgi:hypothetical protein